MIHKIATCCYCGTRAALTLIGHERHELACSTCGAPLSELKMLRSNATAERASVRPLHFQRTRPDYSRRKPSKRRKQRSLSQRFLEEFWDAVDDIDDIFDFFD